MTEDGGSIFSATERKIGTSFREKNSNQLKLQLLSLFPSPDFRDTGQKESDDLE